MRLTCKEASHLLSAECDGRLRFGQRLALRLHLFACNACRRVKAQLGFLQRAMAAYGEWDVPPASPAGAPHPPARPDG